MDYVTIITGILTAIATVMLGYLKTTKPEDFDWVKFVATLLIGLFVGIGTSALGLPADQVTTWLVQGGLTVWIYWLAKVIVRKLGLVGTLLLV